jgi:hypothetical protein
MKNVLLLLTMAFLTGSGATAAESKQRDLRPVVLAFLEKYLKSPAVPR